MTDRNRARTLCFQALMTSILLLSITTALSGQRGRRFEETTSVTVVEVPVQITVGGNPLRTLTRDDFELFDNRKRQEIIGFELVDLSTTTRIQEHVPIAARRHFLALFDLAFSEPDSIGRAQTAVAKLVLDDLHPTDLVAVATYSQARGPQMVLGFTSDRNQIHQAISTLGMVAPEQRIADPLGLVVGDISAELPEPVSAVGSDRPGAQALAEQTRDLQALQGRVGRDQKKNQILALTSSLEAIAQMMNSVEGRKHVLFLSEGFDSSVLVGVQSETLEGTQRIEEMAQAAQDGEYWEIDNEERFGDSQARSGLNQLVAAFRRADCTIQAIDIAGLEAGSHNPNREGMFAMARDTGGELFSNYNDLGEAMSEVLERTNVTYLLAFQPKNLKPDDKFHRLNVKLKNAPRGTEIVHRPGYYPPKPYDRLSPLERRLRSAEQVVGGRTGGSVATAVLAAAFTMPDGKAYVPVLVEIDGKSLLAQFPGDAVTLEIYAYALDPRGTVRDFFARRLGLDLTQARAALEQSGFKYWGHFDLDQGDYTARVLVRNDSTGRSGVAEGQFQVPSMDSGEALLLPPFFPEPFDRWLWGREEEGERRPGAPHPFQLGEDPFFPAAVPQLAPGQQVPVSLMAYNLGKGALAVEATVFDGDGQEVTNAGELALAGDATGGSGLSRLPATFIARDLRAGDYLLRVQVKSQATERSFTSSIPIRVP